MQKDVLEELHLTELDFKGIQRIVPQNSARFAYLIKENTESEKKSRTVPPHYKGVVKSVVSGGSEVNPSLSAFKQNIKTVRRKFILSKSLTSNRNLKNGIEISCPPLPIAISSNKISDAVQEFNVKDNDNQKCLKIRTFSTKSFSNLNVSSTETNLNVIRSTSPELDSFAEPKTLKDVVANDFSRENVEVELRKNSNKCSVSDPLLVNSHVSILKKKSNFKSGIGNAVESYNLVGIDEPLESASHFETVSEPAFCVISGVVGNATDVFSKANNSQEDVEETPETQLIIPKKTNDITKIKGWRRKQFFVEKPTTIEFYSIAKGSLTLKKKIELKNYSDVLEKDSEEPGNVENAFVCDSLDEFLDQDAELNVGFEIPHLYAEFGIKLTSDDIVSRPSLSERDIKEVETRYCVPIAAPCDVINLDDIKEENVKKLKRSIEDDTKPYKILKVEEGQRQSVRFAQKQTGELKINCNENSGYNSTVENPNPNKNESNNSLSNIKLVNKLIALVVYPGPFMPMHPIVQYHLAKIRSYRTKVDKNWANFAASALLVNNKRYKRSILPVQCCVKVETGSSWSSTQVLKADEDVKIIEQKISSGSSNSIGEEDNGNKHFVKGQFKLKKCSVLIEKLDAAKMCGPWCMEHNCYSCAECGLAKPKLKKLKVKEFERKINNRDEESRETFIVSPRASFDKTIASLLAKKVRLLKYNGDTLTSIDCLKTLTPNTVEFIKLKFVKESLLTGYINIWYLKPNKPEVRSRAFLTFSHTPPVPNAINLKSNAFSLNNLPKVITEIITDENTFDSNEYAILHCNGEIWEIHGSLNIAFGKNDRNVEQIFSSVDLPELKKLQEIAFDILHVRAVKWWVLDLTQKFRLIELKSGTFNTVVVRKKFIETIALNLFGFVPLRRDSDNRILGAYIIQKLLPFILIGPYYLLEAHDLILKNGSSIVPFIYYGEENVSTNYPLKFFINSVIKNLEQNDKKLEGLWLYDKMNLDSTSYLEVLTTSLGEHLQNKYSSIDIEHGYSLNSLTNPSSSGATSGIIKRKDGREEFKKVTVYLYFDIFELGFVEGELQFDNSVIISHPLDRRTKMKSHKIGDWFIGIIKRRIDFLPKDLVVRWFITKHKEDLRDRRPFNKFFLGGAHILTKNGVYYLLEMSESKVEKLGLKKSEIFRALAESEVIREVKALKKMADLLPNSSNKSLAMDEVLSKAVKEIKLQQKLESALRNEKIVAEREKLSLLSYFLKILNYEQIPFPTKMNFIEKIEPSFKKNSGELNEEFVKRLKMSRFGRRYLKRIEKKYCLKKILKKKSRKGNQNHTKEKSKSKSERVHVVSNSHQKANILESRLGPKKPIKLLNFFKDTNETKTDCPKYPELHIQIEKLNSISDRHSSFKNIYSKVMQKSASEKEQAEESFESRKMKKNEFSINSPNTIGARGDGFINLLTPEMLNNNMKLCWKNWTVNKLEVS